MGGSNEAWDLAHAAAADAGVRISALTELEDADRVRSIIDLVWGQQVLPRELLRALQHAGCVLLGAHSDRDLVGFVLGFLGFEGGLHLHSHMLAVAPEHRASGVGFALKVAQRALCLEKGIEEARWTFDPLVARNARLNLSRLGAEAVRFFPDFYGEMTDRLNRGDRSDRLEVSWKLASARVEAALRRRLEEPADPKASVRIPLDHVEVRERDPERGRRTREETRAELAACFDAGLIATWFTDDGTYLFESARAEGER